MSFRLSQKVVLEKGDRIRVSGGPYYITETGEKIHMGERGLGYFVSATANGEALWVRFHGYGERFVYIGPDKVSGNTGLIYEAHKIVKLRKET